MPRKGKDAGDDDQRLGPDDVLYEDPLLSSCDGPIESRLLALEHLDRVRAKHGGWCPNCGRDISDERLILHRALDPGICTSAT